MVVRTDINTPEVIGHPNFQREFNRSGPMSDLSRQEGSWVEKKPGENRGLRWRSLTNSHYFVYICF